MFQYFSTSALTLCVPVGTDVQNEGCRGRSILRWFLETKELPKLMCFLDKKNLFKRSQRQELICFSSGDIGV